MPDATRRAVLAAATAGLAGCLGTPGSDPTGDGDGDGGGPLDGDATQVGDLSLSSPEFDDGGRIPARYGYDRENVNPPLRVSGVPDGAASLALVVDDPDAEPVAGKVWVHWLVWNVPPDAREIPADWDPGTAGAVEGENDFGEVGYGGPAPPDEPHGYRFKLYALDSVLDLGSGASRHEVGGAASGHVVARTQLTGTYAPQ
ncbi:MAG: YbhB/YbcL family Raf kinase inhibitor-like protein [Halobacteriaceae archaeon]